ncbi:DEAD-box ATP-dependent RNA helicase CshA [Chitinispirillum alkaliphilum]|nr:DEAD-box ATP-dependent RNA helicase CshA [Chitinispirillum alkaliphilum]
MKEFKDLGLSEKTLNSIRKKGFEEPTEIQSLTIPLFLNDESDIIAQAQTGTGKTAAFALPLLDMLDPKMKHVQALILAPTRELVLQICEEFNSLKGDSGLTIAPIYGGQSMELQLNRLKKGVSIVVGTPGRLLDHIRRKTLNLQKVEFVILDEGDEMLNMGFIEDIEQILEQAPDYKRVLLFSATMPERIKNLASRYMIDTKHIKTKTSLTTNLTDQIYYEVSRRDKFEALCRIVDMESRFYGIVFCRTKSDVDELVSSLIDRGYSSEGIHGDISQSQRESILRKFRNQQINLLVATDVAARGIDINNLTHVINYSLPQNPEAYIHRIGRTGRAGNQGTAVTFITPDEFSKLGFIKRAAKVTMRKLQVPEIGQIVENKKKNITEELKSLISNASAEAHFESWAEELLEGDVQPSEVLTAVLKLSFSKSFDVSSYGKISQVKRSKNRGENDLSTGKTRLFIARGKDFNFTKKSLVDFVVKESGVSRSLIEEVEVHDRFSFMTVPFADAEKILLKCKKLRNGKRPVVSKAKTGGLKRKRK